MPPEKALLLLLLLFCDCAGGFYGHGHHHSCNFWSGCGTADRRRLLYFQYYYFIQLVVAVTVLPQSPPQLCGVALTVKKRAFLCARVPQNYSRNPVCGDHLCLSVCPAGIKVCCRVGIRNLPWSAKEVEQHVYKKTELL